MVAFSDDAGGLGALAQHDHKPIVVQSKPVIERLPVKVIDPVDLVICDEGNIFVADRKAECVFRLDQRGSVSLMVEQLPNIQRIQTDVDGSLYVLTSTGGESSLHQVTGTGHQVVLETFSFPSTSFVRDETGNFTLSVSNSGRLVDLAADGEITERATLTQRALDLTLNAGGQLEALLPSGHVVLISHEGEIAASGFAEIGSTRLASLKDGALLCLANTGTGRLQVARVSRSEERPNQFEVVATVPSGTKSVGFDAMGNLCLANADLRAVTKVTSQFEIPCPHCGKATRMIFRTEPDPAAGGSDARSF